MVKNRIKGVLFGQAIGDALGLGTEFMTKQEVDRFYPNGLTDYDQIIQDYHRKRWMKGDWTDDTEMMLCITNAIIEDKDIKLSTIARNFKEWFNGKRKNGQSPHTGSKGHIWICRYRNTRRRDGGHRKHIFAYH